MVSRMLADCFDECMTFSIELRHAFREMMKLISVENNLFYGFA